MQLTGYGALSEMSVNCVYATKTRHDGKSGSFDELARENLSKKTAFVEDPRTGTFTHLTPVYCLSSVLGPEHHPKEKATKGS